MSFLLLFAADEGSGIPATAFLTEGGDAIITENGDYLVTEN